MLKHSVRHSRAVCALLGLAAACGEGNPVRQLAGGEAVEWNPAGLTEIAGAPVASVKAELERLLDEQPAFINDEQWQHTGRLYDAYDGLPLWMHEEGLIFDRSSALVDALASATGDALNIERYPLAELAWAVDSMRKLDNPPAPLIARTDLLLTAAYVGLGEDYLTGQINPRSVAQSWHIDPQDEEVDTALALALNTDDLAGALGAMRPQDYDYEMLRRKLADLRAIAAAGGYPRVPGGRPLKRGDRDDAGRLRALRARLHAEGFATEDSGARYDQSLAAAIAQFQQRHAIRVDSMLGEETLNALNVPADFRLAQVAANLERYRWLPRTLGDRYILVNVPAFRLTAFDSARTVLEMKVIVGAEYDQRATPVFSDRMEFVVFRPYWNVTDNIAQNELLPKFARTGMPADYELYSDNGVQRLRQKPGARNSLGLVKFMFPNDFNIYLHDTPQQALFDEDIRAFSHGCIRVEKPAELAQWVLGWSADRVQDAMHGSNNRHVQLPEKIPVYIAYMTAYVRDGNLWFGNDLYQRDEELARAVWNGAMPTERAAKAIEILRTLTD